MSSVGARLAGTAVAGLLAAGLVTGCGSSDNNSSANATPTTSSPSPSATPTAPDKPNAAKAEITLHWQAFFNPKTPTALSVRYLEDAAQLTGALAIAAKARQPGQVTTAKVKAIAFTSPTTANVTYDLLLNDKPALPNASGQAVLQDGIWKVSKTTFCTLTQLANAGKPVPGCA